MAGVNIPETAIDNDFSAEMYDIDLDGIYQTVKYFRSDGTLYMQSELSNHTGTRQYKNVTLSYYDNTGTKLLYSVTWELEFDINSTLISRKRVT